MTSKLSDPLLLSMIAHDSVSITCLPLTGLNVMTHSFIKAVASATGVQLFLHLLLSRKAGTVEASLAIESLDSEL